MSCYALGLYYETLSGRAQIVDCKPVREAASAIYIHPHEVITDSGSSIRHNKTQLSNFIGLFCAINNSLGILWFYCVISTFNSVIERVRHPWLRLP